MKTSLRKLLVTLGLGFALATSAHAVPITGSIEIGFGSVQLFNGVNPTTTLLNATGAGAGTAFVSPLSDGDFTGLAFTPVSYAAFNWSPANTPITNLWVAGPASFDLDSLTVNVHTAIDLDISGSGTLYLAGFDPTHGVWSYTINDSDGTANASGRFQFQSSNSVPDGGSTALMLGAALAGAGFLAKRRRKVA